MPVYAYNSHMEKPVNLLLLTHNYPRYEGDHSGVFLKLLAIKLLQFNIRGIILAPHDQDTAEQEQSDGITIHRFRYASNDSEENLAYRGNMQQRIASFSGLLKFRNYLNSFEESARRLIEANDISCIAGHWLLPAGIVMKRLMHNVNLPLVLSSHGTDIRMIGKLGGQPYRYFRSLAHRLHRWTTVSSYLRDEILRLDPSLKDKMEVLPLPHDETLFSVDPAIERNPNLVVCVAHYTEQKRVGGLIEAFGKVAARIPEARLELYGGGPLRQQLNDLIKEKNLTRQVSLFDAVPQKQLRSIYNRASIVVLNSHREGFGLTLSEAMLCGAATIGTASGGIPDIIEHDRRGLLVPVNDNTALAEAILRLMENHSERDQLAEQGQQFAMENYASTPLAKRYAEIIHSAITE